MTSLFTNILHVDMDAFFASVEQRDNPAWRGKPVIVGALPGTRGVVAAASYEARKFGVRSAMPVIRAVRLCPQGIFVEPHFSAYSEASHTVMAILADFTPQIEQVSVDEAYLDITGTEKLWGPPVNVARAIKKRVKDETRLTISVGVAPNKFLAKLASDMNKPNGLTVTPFSEREIIVWLAPLPVGRLFGVGKVTEELFFKQGITTIADVQKLPREYLTKKFGEYGQSLFDLCRGRFDSPVEDRGEAKSVSREHTFQRDTADGETLKSTLLSLSRDVARRARRQCLAGTTVVFIYRGTDFTKHTRRTTLPAPTNISRVIYDKAVELFMASPILGKPVRLIGVGITGFGDAVQTDLFEAKTNRTALEASEKAIDAVVARFGEKAIFLGGEHKNQNLQ
jgi:DNA polymerase IV